MHLRLRVKINSYVCKEYFKISRESKKEVEVNEVLVFKADQPSKYGKGEGVPQTRYNQSVQQVKADLESININMVTRERLLSLLQPGSARNALDCALWDLQCKLENKNIEQILGINLLKPKVSAYTISLNELDKMVLDAKKVSHYPILKIKLGEDANYDLERIQAIREVAPATTLIVDANEGWLPEDLPHIIFAMEKAGVKMIEQPVAMGKDDVLKDLKSNVTICADESAHTSKDLERLVGLYDMVNIKLDKTGGLTEALRMKELALKMGFSVMVGCMLGSSMGIMPAFCLAQNDVEYIDLDCAALLANDIDGGLIFDNGVLMLQEQRCWGNKI